MYAILYVLLYNVECTMYTVHVNNRRIEYCTNPLFTHIFSPLRTPKIQYNTRIPQVLEPCIKTCFKQPDAEVLVTRGAQMLYLLLDCAPPPDCELVSIAPSSLNLSDSLHCSTFLKYYDILIRWENNGYSMLDALCMFCSNRCCFNH